MVEDSTGTKGDLFYVAQEYYAMIDNTSLFRERAVDIAIDECISEGILVEFLSRNRAEAAMFTIHEHNEERECMKLKESHKQYAYEQGREEGIKKSLHNLMKNQGITEEEARIALGLKK